MSYKMLAYQEFDEQEKNNWFTNQPKCRYYGTVKKVEDIQQHECFSILKITLNNNIVLNQPGFNYTTLCDGGSNLYKQYTKEIIPKIGDKVYGIANKEEFSILKYGKQEYDSHTEIPICVGKDEYFQNDYYPIIGVISLLILSAITFRLLLFKKHKHSNNKTS